MPSEPDNAAPPDPLILHASCVALEGRAVLIRGASGQGKSGLALMLMALGAKLVADDRTCVWVSGDTLYADAPEPIRSQIEAREVGILTADPAGPSPLSLVIDMDQTENARLPQRRDTEILGIFLPLLRKSALPHFPAAIAAYLRGTRQA